MKISPNFSREEFACKCGCGFDTVDIELIQVCEEARSFIGPFTPNSACRCPSHNHAVGGGSKSQHLIGRACDIPCEDPVALYNYLDNLHANRFGIGLYRTFVHIDTRVAKARWDKSDD